VILARVAEGIRDAYPSASGWPSAVASTMLSGGNGRPVTGRPPRMPNGMSTTIECE
jgi:hypothetical protein